jgi:septum site-determining protein MinD
MGKIVGIMSLKGGVGKTSVVASLGSALAEFGKKVLLVDANFSAPNLGVHFNIIDPEVTLHDVMNRKAKVDDAIYAVGELDILPSSIFSTNQVNFLKLKDNIRSLKKRYDFILLDSPPTLSEEGLATLYASDEIFFVSTPDHATLSNTLKSLNRAIERGNKVNGIILNKVYDREFELSLDDIESTTNVPIMAVVPHDVRVLEAQSHFISPTEWKPKSKGTKEFKKLAAAMTGEKYEPFDWRKYLKRTPPKQDVNRRVFYERVFKD